MKCKTVGVLKVAGLVLMAAVATACSSQQVTFEPQTLRTDGTAGGAMVDDSVVRTQVIAVQTDGSKRPTGIDWTWDNVDVTEESAETNAGVTGSGKSTYSFRPGKVRRLDLVTTASSESLDGSGMRQSTSRRSRVSLAVDERGTLTLLNANDPAGQVTLPNEAVLKMNGQGDLFDWQQDVLITYERGRD